MSLLFPILILVGLAIAVGVIALLKAVKGAGSADDGVPPYVLRPSLFTPAERSFLGVLERIDLGELALAAKVRLADIVAPEKGLAPAARQRALNRVNPKHVDFLLVRRSDGRPMLAIELDDKSHARADRAQRDAFVDKVYSACGLPVLHVEAKNAYDPREVMRRIEETLAPKPAAAA